MFNIFAAAQDSVKPVSMASGSQQGELIDQTSEQDCTWKQFSPAAAAAHKNVPVPIFIQDLTTAPSTEMLSVNERKRKRDPHDHNHQENSDFDQVHVKIFSNTFYSQIILLF